MERSEKSLTENFEPQIEDYSDAELQSKIDNLMQKNVELTNIRSYIIDKKINEIENEGFTTLIKAAVPSFILLLISFFIDVSAVPFLGDISKNMAQMLFGQEVLNQGVTPIQFWWLPIIAYVIFMFCAFLSNKSLKREISLKGASEGAISRIIDRYSGIVDAIGTALPLLGAAILLLSIKEGPAVFLGFSVPFEIKSIIILAMAKLFDSVFDAQALKYQEIQEEINKVETEYFFNKEESIQASLLHEIKELRKGSLTSTNGTAYKEVSKDQLEAMYKVMHAINTENQQFAANLNSLQQVAAKLSTIKLVDQQTMNDVAKVSEVLSGVTSSMNKSTENTAVIKENMETIRKIVAEINNIKLPDEKILKELQATSQKLTETMNNMKEPGTTKAMENLVYIIGKR